MFLCWNQGLEFREIPLTPVKWAQATVWGASCLDERQNLLELWILSKICCRRIFIIISGIPCLFKILPITSLLIFLKHTFKKE